MFRRLRRLARRAIARSWRLSRLWYRFHGLPLDGAPDEEVWYFAFGSNMHDDVFRGRRRMRPREWRVARIAGYRLRFNLEGRPRGRSAPANIEACAGEEVWGVAYRITRRELLRLNGTEGIPGGYYRPVWLDAEDTDRRPVHAVAYAARGGETDGNPSLRYIALLREGARAHGLPDRWIEKLERIRPADHDGKG
ncbi:MAG: gamma-glutamylcyclotransferase [Defluviicoccus sp.]|nr:gamma-glutamylcyclotransferase [Defluviicoccus sp.]